MYIRRIVSTGYPPGCLQVHHCYYPFLFLKPWRLSGNTLLALRRIYLFWVCIFRVIHVVRLLDPIMLRLEQMAVGSNGSTLIQQGHLSDVACRCRSLKARCGRKVVGFGYSIVHIWFHGCIASYFLRNNKEMHSPASRHPPRRVCLGQTPVLMCYHLFRLAKVKPHKLRLQYPKYVMVMLQKLCVVSYELPPSISSHQLTLRFPPRSPCSLQFGACSWEEIEWG